MKDGISKSLNTTFESEEVNTKISKVNNTLLKVKSNRLVIENVEYLRNELKESLESAQTIRFLLEENLRKPPHSARDVEAYTLVLSQIKEIARELRQLDSDAAALELNQRKLDKQLEALGQGQIGTQINNTFLLDSKQLAGMISDAKKNSTMKSIDATFAVDKFK
jgi:hypothetical protein